MAVFDDMMAAGGAGLLMQVHGADEAVEIAALGGSKKKYSAIVGILSVEEVTQIEGKRETTSYRDICRLFVSCPPGTAAVKAKVAIAKYAGPDFYVRSIEGMTDNLTTIQVWRESLAKIQRRGTEGQS